jgi:hypothetical protein
MRQQAKIMVGEFDASGTSPSRHPDGRKDEKRSCKQKQAVPDHPRFNSGINPSSANEQ